MRTRPWPPPPVDLVLGPDDVHVWRVDLAVDDNAVQVLGRLLAPDEQQRASRYRLARERRRFMVARGSVRAILGRYVDRDPHELGFALEPGGKPLVAGHARGAVEFSLSHSGDCALLAVSRGRRLGVDVELIRDEFDWQGIAVQLFTARELTRLAALSGAQRAAACFRRWTRAEAWLKARGESLASTDTLQRPSKDDVWLVRALDVAPGYAAALAVEGRGWTLRCFQSAGTLTSPSETSPRTPQVAPAAPALEQNN